MERHADFVGEGSGLELVHVSDAHALRSDQQFVYYLSDQILFSGGGGVTNPGCLGQQTFDLFSRIPVCLPTEYDYLDNLNKAIWKS